MSVDQNPLDVLIVGAGPTGLTLAAQLSAYGVGFRLVDAQLDRVHESRALAIQPRTLEVLAPFGVADQLVSLGNPAVQVRMHVAGKTAHVTLSDIGIADTAYPFLLFLSQAETERILADHLADHGVTIERGVQLVALDRADDQITCVLRHRDGRQETVPARYVVGCDGAHSTVRQQAGIAFAGAAYPQTFLLADLEVDGLEPGAVHSYLTRAGILFFFPLGQPATWRMLAMRTTDRPAGAEVTLAELQAAVAACTTDRLHLRDPVWITAFRIHVRGAAQYRADRILLAGDAAHIHSPAGAQGMNTGIQDAVNLGWKLALVCRHQANPALLDTYDTERAKVGRAVLRLTDRLFTLATTTNPLIRTARTRLVPLVAPLALKARPLRAAGFRTVSQLAIRYRNSPASSEGRPTPRRGPHAGDRLPDAPVLHNGQLSTLHTALASPGFHLLICGSDRCWPSGTSTQLTTSRPDLLTQHRLTAHPEPGDLQDPDGTALKRLGLNPEAAAHYLVRPDGYVGYRATGTDLTGLQTYLTRWLSGPHGR